MRAAAETAARLGYHVHIEPPPIVGEARAAAEPLLERALHLARPACWISSGETTVHVRGRGRGGRNQELALASLERLATAESAIMASVGTDGVDGPTDAAGAFVDSTMWSALGAAAGAVIQDALIRNDAYPLLDRLGALVRTGPSGTNVGDLQIVLVDG